jgi:hypothetical protein
MATLSPAITAIGVVYQPSIGKQRAGAAHLGVARPYVDLRGLS